jgi:hypothetical protein
MLRAVGMSNGFWAEAAMTAVYLGNIPPHTALKNKTPIEIWSRRRPSLHGIHEFGTITYAYKPKALCKKLDNKSEKCVLLGYTVGTKAYCLWRIRDHCIIISRDVTFDDNSYLQDSPHETQINTNVPSDEQAPETNEEASETDEEASETLGENIEANILAPVQATPI